MPDIISHFLIDIGVSGEYERQLLFYMTVAWIIILLMRFFLSVSYKGHIAIVKSMAKKGLKDKSELNKPAFLKRAAKEYAQLGERGLAHIDARELAKKNMREFKLLFWSFDSIELLLNAIEPSFLFIGILLTVLASSKEYFAGATLIIFVGGKLFASFFDYKTAREELLSESAFLLSREMGKLYSTDIPASINNLRTELKNAMTYQAKFLSEAIKELGDRLSNVAEKTLGDTAETIAKTLASVSASAETVQKPLDEWRTVILESQKTHDTLNLALSKMGGAADTFIKGIDEMDKLISGYKAVFLDNNKNVEKELERLNTIASVIIEAGAKAVAQTAAVDSTLDYIRSNQSLLENSMNQYETALKEITSSVGDGLGKIISYHTQASYQAISDAVSDSIKQNNVSNNETMSKLQSLFDRILEQSKSETALILSLKEQMDIDMENKRLERREVKG